ncbi:MAG: transcription elongation factor GreB [Dissulfurispiraceae bacterium]|jgi:transcription elongation factor GreB|nr:transcription elongation factor GreB [Dissulfurispiraceae bacterium]
MRRHKTDAPKGSPYITPEGYKVLHDELNHLWKVKRPQVTQAVADAAAMGDRSENAEYIYGKKQLRQIDSRVRFLMKRLNELKVVERKPADQSRVFFGAYVKVEDGDGNCSKYRIVGADESDAARSFISIDSPMAKALIGKTEGDEVSVRRPAGTAVFYIVSIQY